MSIHAHALPTHAHWRSGTHPDALPRDMLAATRNAALSTLLRAHGVWCCGHIFPAFSLCSQVMPILCYHTPQAQSAAPEPSNCGYFPWQAVASSGTEQTCTPAPCIGQVRERRHDNQAQIREK